MSDMRATISEVSERPLRLLGLSGSLRSASFSTAILEAMSNEANRDFTLKVKTLGDLPLYNEDFDREPATVPVTELRAEVMESDGVVIATPEYNHGIPGVLKNALDWASRPAFSSCFAGKPVLIITSAPGSTGGVRAQYQLRETLVSMHAHIVPGREIVLANVADLIVDGSFANPAALRVVLRGFRLLGDEIEHCRLRASR